MKRIGKILWIKGRINRVEYAVTTIVIFIFLTSIKDSSGQTPDLLLPLVYVFYAQSGKRCQDKGMPWYKAIISPVQTIFNFVDKGQDGTNQYGEAPNSIFEPFKT